MANPMHFERYGRTYHLRIQNREELESVLELDDSLWIATSAPIAGLNGDEKFLELLDMDGNGRVRVDELRAGIRWLIERLEGSSSVAGESDSVPLAALDEDHPEGVEMLDTARYILAALGVEEGDSVSLQEVSQFEAGLDSRVINGDGVVPPAAAEEPDLRSFIQDVLTCVGGEEDRTGRQGVTEADLDRFLNEARSYLDWIAEADLPDGTEGTEIMPLGEETPAAWQALKAVRGKVEEFFAQCRYLRFRPSAALSGGDAEPVDFTDPQAIQDSLERAPLAQPVPEGLLPLEGELNPAFADAMARFRRHVVKPLFGEETDLGEEQWRAVKSRLAAYGEWLARKRGETVEELGRERLRECLHSQWPQAVRDLLKEDREVADKLAAAAKLKKLLFYRKHLLQLANNFVSFPDLYDRSSRAMFEKGSLVIDGRWLNFAVRVEEVGRHKEVARTSRMYVLYVRVQGGDGAEDFTVAVPVTSGRVGNLCIGKRGVFRATDGRHHEAQVVDVIENPVSFREAMLAPFVRLGRFVGGKIEAISSAAEKEVEAQMDKVTQQVQAGVQEAVREAPQVVRQSAEPSPSGTSAATSKRDLLIGASLSVAALSSAFAFVTRQLAAAMQTPSLLGGALVLILLIVFVPVAAVAAFKLARRDLSAILEGSGWAINARMRLSRRQGRQFTRSEPFPAEATGTPRRRWLLAVLLLVLAALVAFGLYRVLRTPGKQAPPAQEQTVPGAGQDSDAPEGVPVPPSTDAPSSDSGAAERRGVSASGASPRTAGSLQSPAMGVRP